MNLNVAVDTLAEQLAIWLLIAVTIILVTNFVWKKWVAPWFIAKSAMNMRSSGPSVMETAKHRATSVGSGMDELLRSIDTQLASTHQQAVRESKASCLKQ